MKAVIVLLLIAAIASASLDNELAVTREFVNKINAMNPGWTAGMNERFDGITIKEAKSLCGSYGIRDRNAVEMKYDNSVQLPTSFDARAQWPKCPSIGHIRDQANCGSCWAFGAAEAWSDRICIETNATDTKPRSTYHLVGCDNNDWGCNGGWLDSAWAFIKQYGLVTGGDYQDWATCAPYPPHPCDHHVNGTYGPCPSDDWEPDCPNKCQSKYSTPFNQDIKKASTAYAVRGEQNMMNEIYQNGPIEVAFTVYSDFLTYKSGVYRHVSGTYLGGHAVRMLGYGEEKGVKYWLIANSWNEGWGDKGYFKILKGTDECGIEDDGYAGKL